MTLDIVLYPGRRISYDGALCTVRCEVNSIPGTKGAWLGIEWDNPERGKHNGTHAGVTYFHCRSEQPSIASFVRPTRKPDPERTVLEAITSKYASNSSNAEAVVISGKIAEEVGFDKVSKEQSVLSELRLVVLDHSCVHGIAPRNASRAIVEEAQMDLAKTCPNIVELDLGHNPIETWAQIEDICVALPKLKILRLNCLRLRDLESSSQPLPPSCMSRIEELHLNECLLRPSEILQILQGSGTPRLKSLQSLWLSQNELSAFSTYKLTPVPSFDTVKTLMLENNLFTSLDSVPTIISIFPNVAEISLQSNKISSFSTAYSESAVVPPYATLKTLNLSRNNITSWSFVDVLPKAFPALSSLRISKNPFYDDLTSTSTSQTNPSDTSYYLTIARIPTLQNLNHAKITNQEREEGEIYFLSIAEKDIRATIAAIIPSNNASASKTLLDLTTKYPRYKSLCQKHDHDNLITQFQSFTFQTPTNNHQSALPQNQPSIPSAPPGSLASRLITSTFYILSNLSTSGTTTFTRSIPSTITTSSVFALVARTMTLPSLSFKLIYESEELDPSRDDTTTRSQLYKRDLKGGRGRWDDWGDWDADAMVDEGGEDGDSRLAEGKWTDDGVLVKDGRKWRKREVEMLFGMRGWGEWLEKGVGACRVRVVPIQKGGKGG